MFANRNAPEYRATVQGREEKLNVNEDESTAAVETAQVPIHHFSEENAEPEIVIDVSALRDAMDPAKYGFTPIAPPEGWHGGPLAAQPEWLMDGEMTRQGWWPAQRPKRYKNHRSVRLACYHCTHPEADDSDRLLLAYIGDYTSGSSGRKAYPGNKRMARVLRLKDSATDNRIAKLIRLGLIERTARADGRGNASEYRLVLESPHFPEYVEGEALIELEPAAVRFDRELCWLTPEQQCEVFRWLADRRKERDKRRDLELGRNLPACMNQHMLVALREMVQSWGHA